MPKKLIIVGGGEQGRVTANVASYNSEYEFIGFLDDAQKTELVIGGIKDYVNYLATDTYFFIALGDNKFRRELYEKFLAAGARFVNVIHPKAVLEKDAVLGTNIFIGAHVYVNINTTIGDNTIINNGCIIEHDNKIGAHCHLAPGIITAGGVTIGDSCLIGMGSVIMEDLTVESGTIVGAASNILSSTTGGSLYYGNPARLIKKI